MGSPWLQTLEAAPINTEVEMKEASEALKEELGVGGSKDEDAGANEPPELVRFFLSFIFWRRLFPCCSPLVLSYLQMPAQSLITTWTIKFKIAV